jgi:hypothetical protein
MSAIGQTDSKSKELDQLAHYWERIGFQFGNLGMGLAASIILGIGNMIAGAISAIKNTNNRVISNQSNNAMESALNDQISIKDFEKLSKSQPLENTRYLQTAKFIDRIEELAGSLKDGLQVGDNYIFSKSLQDSGEITYKVIDAKTQSVVADFNLDPDGNIKVTPTRKIPGAQDKLMSFVANVSEKIGLDLEIEQRNAIQFDDVPTALSDLADRTEQLNQSLAGLTNDNPAEQAKTVDTLLVANDQLRALQIDADRIRSAIDSAEIANAQQLDRDPESNASQITKISLLRSKLAGINQAIAIAEKSIGVTHETLNDVKTIPGDPSLSAADEAASEVDEATYQANFAKRLEELTNGNAYLAAEAHEESSYEWTEQEERNY